MRERIWAKVQTPVPVKVRIAGAAKATVMLQSRLYVATVTTLAPSMPAMTTAAMATGVRMQIMAHCAMVVSNGSKAK